MAKAFNKEIRRSITHSLGRFIAIFAIVALGVGFYAGLRMTAPDMKLAADKFYDDSALMDLRVVSSMGMTEEDMDALRAVSGVDQVMAAYETDAVGTYDGENQTFRVQSLAAAAAESLTLPDGPIASDQEDYLNRLELLEGRWPESANECVVLGDVIMTSPIEIGQSITLTEGTGDLADILTQRNFIIVGTARSSYYTASTSLGTTSIGSGDIDQILYVPSAAFASDYPFTEAFLTVAGAASVLNGSDDYKALVKTTEDAILAIASDREQARQDQLKAQAQRELAKAQATYDEQAADAKNELANAQASLDAAAEELASKTTELAQGQQTYDENLKTFQDQKKQAEQALAKADQTIADQEKTLSDTRATLDENRKTLEAQEAALSAQEAIYGKEPLAAQRQALEAAKAKLSQGEAALAAGEKALAEAKKSLVTQRKETQKTLDLAQASLDEAAATLQQGSDALAQGQKSYEEGQADYATAKADADRELADGQRKLDEAQEAIDAIERPEWLVLDRTKNYGLEIFRQDAERVDSIAQVFPFIFFLVAALVALTTMTRMVDEERTLIGTLKALGYSRRRIIAKYLVYAGAASVGGAVVGIAALSFTLPAVIMNAYSIIYVVPVAALALDWPIALLAAGLGVGITLGATALAAGATLRETPAALMLPPAPKPGKRILLERIGPLWRRTPFLWKVTFRNIFRYKKRLFMTVIGIAGCTALLLTGFGLQNSINDIIDKHFGRIVTYTVAITQESDAPSSDNDALAAALAEASDGPVARIARESLLAVASDGKTRDLTVVVPEDFTEFSQLWRLQDRQTGAAIALDDGGAVLSEKLANTLDVMSGDTLEISEKDSMGNASGARFEVPVAAITENYVNNFVFLTPALYEKVFGKAPDFATTLGSISEDEGVRQRFADATAAIESVKTVQYNDETIDSYRKSLRSVNMVVIVLIVAAAALAFIVLYNLTNINISERIREIATLKVLGFTRSEVRSYIFRETIILTVIGAILGLFLGIYLESFVVQTAEVDMVMFGREIHPDSFLWAFLLTLGFGFLVMIFMGRKLRKVSMVESLKSVE